MRYSLYIGRWQPFHNGHKYIIDDALKRGENVLIGIRDTEQTDADPYTVEQRERMILGTYRKEAEEGRVKVIALPDIGAIVVGRNVGYEVRDLTVEVPEDVKGISATGIRDARASGDESWLDCVPAQVANVIDALEPAGNGRCIWLTGLSGAGKSAIAKELAAKFDQPVKILDGDEVRQGINWDLGFSKEDRDTNIKRVAFVAKTICDVGGIAIVACISPYDETRKYAEELIGPERFRLVHVTTPLETCEERDTKGLYAKARAGEIPEFTGVSDPYEAPENPHVCIDTTGLTPAQSAQTVFSGLRTTQAGSI